jgi:hypothetical protein
MRKEITDLRQLDSLVVGEEIPFYISESESAEGLRFDYAYCWGDQHRGKEIMIFARGADSTHILAYITQKEWFKITEGKELVMQPPKLSFGYSHSIGDFEFGVLFRALNCKNPTAEEMELFRRGRLYHSFFGM